MPRKKREKNSKRAYVKYVLPCRQLLHPSLLVTKYHTGSSLFLPLGLWRHTSIIWETLVPNSLQYDWAKHLSPTLLCFWAISQMNGHAFKKMQKPQSRVISFCYHPSFLLRPDFFCSNRLTVSYKIPWLLFGVVLLNTGKNSSLLRQADTCTLSRTIFIVSLPFSGIAPKSTSTVVRN